MSLELFWLNIQRSLVSAFPATVGNVQFQEEEAGSTHRAPFTVVLGVRGTRPHPTVSG